MTRKLTKNNNGNLEFQEFVWDDDEDNVEHPLTNIVELDKKGGSEVSSAKRTPSWLQATVNELGVNSNKERWEEEVNVTIVDPDDNLEPTTYTFLFRATDTKEETDHRVKLTVE